MTRWERLVGLLLLLQSSASGEDEIRPWLTAGQAAEHFGVSRRTILRDIAALGEMGVPVFSRDGVRGGYALAPDYTPQALPLTLRETLLLLLALSSIEKLGATPFGPARETLVGKLRALISPALLDGADRLLDHVALEVPDRSYLPTQHLEALFAAAQAGRWMTAEYRSERGLSRYSLLPERLSAINGVWYCEATAWKEGWSGPPEPRTFRLDRFVSLAPGDDPPLAARIPTPKAPLPYQHASHPEVVVRLTARGAERAEMERHLGSSVVHTADGAEMRFRCPPGEMDWMARYFFGFGEEAEVLEPAGLREAIRDLARGVARRYGAESPHPPSPSPASERGLRASVTGKQ